MKITSVEAIPVHLPFVEIGAPFIAFGRRFTGMELLLVRIETDDGLVGWGESPWGFWKPIKSLIDDYLSKVLVGQSTENPGALTARLQRMTYVLGRHGLTMYALSAIDTALHDIAGKRAGKPLYELLGGESRALKVYATLWGVDQPRDAPHVPDPDMLARLTGEAADAGYGRVKLHGISPRDVAIAQEAAGPDVGIMCDAACRVAPEQVGPLSRELADLGVLWLEEPLFPPEDYPALARAREVSALPIAAGENACTRTEFEAIFAASAVDIAQPNVNRVGGVTEFHAIAQMARDRDIELAAFGVMFGPGYMATLHLLAAANAEWIEQLVIPFTTFLYGDALTPRDGRLTPPDGPGLGRDPDPAVVSDLRID